MCNVVGCHDAGVLDWVCRPDTAACGVYRVLSGDAGT